MAYFHRGKISVFNSSNIFILMFFLGGFLMSQSVVAQVAPLSNKNQHSFKEDVDVKNIKSFDLNFLKSPKTPEDLLAVLKLISNNFLLLNKDFQKDEFLLKLFGPGEISDPYADYSKIEGIKNRDISLAKKSILRTKLKIDGFGFSFAIFLDQQPAKSSASLQFITSTSRNPFSAESIASQFADSVWYDPLENSRAVLNQETREMAARRPLRNNQKEYFQIDEIRESEAFISTLKIELGADGTLHGIQINQREK